MKYRLSQVLTKIYFYFLTFFFVGYFASTLNPQSIVTQYYRILISFNKAYLISYAGLILSSAANVFALLPIFLYIYKRNLFSKRFWQNFLIFRIAADAQGHLYEMITLKALFRYPQIYIGVFSALFILFTLLPSYWICWRYACKREPAFGPQPLNRQN